MRQKLVSLTPVCLKHRATVVVGACAQSANHSVSLQQSNRNYHSHSLRKYIPVGGLTLKVSELLSTLVKCGLNSGFCA